MKKAKTYLFNCLAGFIFIALLAVNVQVGSGNGFLGIGENFVNNANASCPLYPDVCYVVEYPDGTRDFELGAIIITPDE
jgi:hypothetical protein